MDLSSSSIIFIPTSDPTASSPIVIASTADPTLFTSLIIDSTAAGSRVTVPSPTTTSTTTSPPTVTGPVLCSIAFTREYSFEFVSNNSKVVEQIGYYTPRAIAYALNLPDLSNITIVDLQSYDTSAQGYLTTLALFEIPSSLVPPSRAQITQATSRLHSNSSDVNLNEFVSLIDPTYPLTGVVSATTPSGAGGSLVINEPTDLSSTTPSSAIASPSATSEADHSLPRAVKSGIVVGSVLGGIILLALTIFLVKRYRKKARMNRLYAADDAIPQQMLEKDGQPRSELGGKMQPIEKDSVTRNELYSDMPIWELSANEERVLDKQSDTDTSITSRSHKSDNLKV